MGEYRNGKWHSTFGDVQAGIADEAPGELPMPTYNAELLQRVAELSAELARYTGAEANEYGQSQQKIKRLEAKCERYRDALEWIILQYDPKEGCECSAVNRIANKALEEK